MKFYFSSADVTQLASFSPVERRQIIEMAASKLAAPEKLLLNIIKLLILIPPFIMLARIDSWWLFLPLVLLLVGYFVIVRPITLYFVVKHIDEAIKQFKRTQG